MTLPAEPSPHSTANGAEPRRYCFDGCPHGAEPVPITEPGEGDDHTGLVTGIGFVIAALETAVWLALL